MTRILIVEDEQRIASFIEKGLHSNGFVTVVAVDGPQALERLRTDTFDLVILDLGLPALDGFDVLRTFRERDRRTPILILTARDGVPATVEGFELGADDYVTKPFSFEELLARIRARLRSDATTQASVLQAGACSLDLRTRKLTVDDRVVELTAREFAMLETFLRHPGQVLSREQLLGHVWGFNHDPGSNVVDVYVGYVRKKLGGDRISTVRGMGYRFDP